MSQYDFPTPKIQAQNDSNIAAFIMGMNHEHDMRIWIDENTWHGGARLTLTNSKHDTLHYIMDQFDTVDPKQYCDFISQAYIDAQRAIQIAAETEAARLERSKIVRSFGTYRRLIRRGVQI